MRKTLLGLSATVVVLACGAALYGLAMELPNEGPVDLGWKFPAGVADLASSRNRVHGFMSTFGYADLWYAANVEVKSGGEIEQFVAKHRAAKAKP